MEVINRQLCLHHPLREAVARCPECRQFFCRECITEHEDRVICADCLKQLAQVPEKARERFSGPRRWLFCLLGFLVSWLFFYESGKVLLLLPSSFHDGTLWQSDGSGNP